MSDRSELWNSPVVNTYLVWELVRGYEQGGNAGMPILLVFLAMALLVDETMRQRIADVETTSLEGLSRAVLDSCGKDSVSFAGLTQLIAANKDGVRKAIEFALAARLIGLNTETATLETRYGGDNRSAESKAKRFYRAEGMLAARLGSCFAGESPDKIATLLEVDF